MIGTMTGPLTRILLRYGAGVLIAWGVFSPVLGEQLASDPDVAMALQVGIGVAVAALTEGYYWLARRQGWST